MKRLEYQLSKLEELKDQHELHRKMRDGKHRDQCFLLTLAALSVQFRSLLLASCYCFLSRYCHHVPLKCNQETGAVITVIYLSKSADCFIIVPGKQERPVRRRRMRAERERRRDRSTKAGDDESCCNRNELIIGLRAERTGRRKVGLGHNLGGGFLSGFPFVRFGEKAGKKRKSNGRRDG